MSALKDRSRTELIRFIEEARTERDGLQRDVYRVLDERETILQHNLSLTRRITQLENEMNKTDLTPPAHLNCVAVNLLVSDALCASIMCTALEGGIGYWCVADKIVRTGTRAERDAGADWSYVSFLAADTEGDGSDDDAFKPATVDYTVIRRGIETLFKPTTKVSADIRSWVLRDIMSQPEIEGNIDADAADVIVQLGLLGEITFG